MELIVLKIGLDLKIISPTLLAMMVLMALATTMTTAPLLQLLICRSVSRRVRCVRETKQAIIGGA